ncbi:NUDIX domain-containing protein [Paenibacillus sp. H1-7]|uniref:NUDIX domain-containing protein n=1 Tax=Paenibacillus sp. H1-7 TaxID=2282849 RepID=UPI001EF9AE3C|nr:NUDIX domain-containing protein [Paenibacillus sp. H1-7]
MIPGGIVEAGESLEEAVIRELKEETGISAVPTRIIGVRSGVRQVGNSIETGIYVVFEMDYLSVRQMLWISMKFQALSLNQLLKYWKIPKLLT